MRLPPASPNLNSYAERFVGSVRRECLSRVVLVGERHLGSVLNGYLKHDLAERPHQSLDNDCLTGPSMSLPFKWHGLSLGRLPLGRLLRG